MSGTRRPGRFPSVGDELVRERIVAYIEENGYITNRKCRALLDVGYDEAIGIFNWLVADGVLERTGSTGGTRYVIPAELK